MTKVQSLALGGISMIALVVGVLLAGGAMTSAQSTTVTASPTPVATSSSGSATSPTPAPSGTFKSNEDATHETGESAAREAAEDSGQGGHGPGGGHPNEDPTHESNESSDHEAQEDAGIAATATPGA